MDSASEETNEASQDDLHPSVQRELVLASFREIESSFRNNHRILWLLTLLGPPVLTVLIVVSLYFFHGWTYTRDIVAFAFLTFFFFGRFAIPFVEQLNLPSELSARGVFALVTYMDLMVAFIIPFHIGLIFRIPWLGPKVSALVADGQFILQHNPWMKRASFLGLIAFVMFPLAATGSVGGAIFSRLLGMSRLASILGIAIGSLLGNGIMFLFANFFREHLNKDDPLVQYGGIAVIVVIIIVLERRYRAAKRRYMSYLDDSQQKQRDDAAEASE